MMPRWSQWLACGLLLWQASQGFGADAQAPGNAQERLEQARQFLMEQAMRASTRVDAYSWVDGAGRLQEHQSMRQSIEWPALSAPGQAQAARDLVMENGNQAPACPSYAGSSHLHTPLALRTQWPDRLPPAIRQRLQETLVLHWQGIDAQRPWRMFRVPQMPVGLSTYERLLRTPALPQSPWKVDLKLDVVPATKHQTTRLAWRLAVTERDRLHIEQRAELDLPVRLQPWGAAVWTDDAWQQVDQLLRTWAQLLDRQFACIRVRPEVVAGETGGWTLNMGSMAGLRVGDEWVLLDPVALPERTLEAGAIDQMVVARVVKVDAMRAELALVAGQAKPPRAGWIAYPLDDLQSAQSALPAIQHARR